MQIMTEAAIRLGEEVERIHASGPDWEGLPLDGESPATRLSRINNQNNTERRKGVAFTARCKVVAVASLRPDSRNS